MQPKNFLEEFRKEWEEFLAERGHRVWNPKGIGCVLLSRNAEKKVYRWLLFLAHGESRTLNQSELADLKIHMKRAKSLNQEAYVAIRFQKPGVKLLILPVAKAMQAGRIFPTKGGIPWYE